jgi:hypothetical protein
VSKKPKKVVFAKRSQIFGAGREQNLQRFQVVARPEGRFSIRKKAQKNGQKVAKFPNFYVIFGEKRVNSSAIREAFAAV